MSEKLSKYLTGLCKNHNIQHALLNTTENWKSNLNKGNKAGPQASITGPPLFNILISDIVLFAKN